MGTGGQRSVAAGLPVLGSIYSQAVEELVEEGRTGFVFDPLVESSVLAALDRAFGTPSAVVATMWRMARQRSLAVTPAAASERIVSAMEQVLLRAPERPAVDNQIRLRFGS